MGRLEGHAIELFTELCDLSAAEQAGRLDEIGKRDPALRADIEELLEGDRLSDGRLDEKVAVPTSLVSVDRGKDSARETLLVVERLVTRTHAFEHYRIEGEVGRGGMGRVLEVWDEDLERRLAMKVIATERPPVGPDAAASETRAMARFLDEARVTSQLDHPGIVPVHELGLDAEGRVYFTMKLVRGRTLHEIFELVAKGEEDWSRTRALGVLLKVCEAMAYAHSKDIVHRDLKPANVMVGRFGEAYVMDWGVARVRGRADGHDLRPRNGTGAGQETAAIESPVVTLDGTVVGTPYYMPPEQAAGRPGAIDARSDVYALGAMLYHLLAGRPPYSEPERSLAPHAVLARVLDGPPAPVQTLAREAPAEVCAICEKAMARSPADRYADTAKLSDDLRAFLEGRVVHAHEAGAWAEARKWVKRNKALAAACGVALLVLILGLGVSLALGAQSERNAATAKANAERADRAAEAATRRADEVLRLAALQDLEDLLTKTDGLWPAIPENVAAYEKWIDDARKLVADLPVHREKREELRSKALPQSAAERRAEREGHPEYPRWVQLEDELETAADSAAAATTDEEVHATEEKLAALEEERSRIEARLDERREWTFPPQEPEARWWNNQLTKLIEGLERVELRGLLSDDGTVAEHGWSIPKRLAFARAIEFRSVSGPQAAARWDQAIASIRDRAQCPRYDGLELRPQLGLLPIGRDPASGMWEFAHLATGEPAERGADGRLVLSEATGLVLVLVPGGTFWMGAQSSNDRGTNHDPEAVADETPVHTVTLLPCFLSKYEMTQGQWLRAVGKNPSTYGPKRYDIQWDKVPRGWSALHPVEHVSWTECSEVAKRLVLELPSEAQWEYACRAGTTSVYSCGAEKECLDGVANLSDAYGKSHGNENWSTWEPWLDDGHSEHAEVGSYRANAFGLHDMHGNVWEWCRDGFDVYTAPVRAGDGVRLTADNSSHPFRGGSFTGGSASARSATRGFAAADHAIDDIGLRPSLRIDR